MSQLIRRTDDYMVLLSPRGSADISDETEFSLADATGSVLLLDHLGFDLLLFGWQPHGRLHTHEWPDEGPDSNAFS